MIRARLAITFAVLAVAIMTGCGGGSGNSGGGEAESLTSKELIEKADSICSQTEEKIEARFAEILKEGKGKEAKATLEALETIGIPRIRLQLEALRELEPPESLKAKMTAYLDALEEEIKAGEKDPQALNGSASKVFAKSDAAAKGIGFKVCASSGA